MDLNFCFLFFFFSSETNTHMFDMETFQNRNVDDYYIMNLHEAPSSSEALVNGEDRGSEHSLPKF